MLYYKLIYMNFSIFYIKYNVELPLLLRKIN